MSLLKLVAHLHGVLQDHVAAGGEILLKATAQGKRLSLTAVRGLPSFLVTCIDAVATWKVMRCQGVCVWCFVSVWWRPVGGAHHS
jgi:hypothetical protein